MSITVDIHYGVTFGKGDSSDWIDWEIDLDDEAEEAYLRAKKLRLDLNEIDILKDALDEVYDEIEEQEIENSIDCEDEYVLECQGMVPVDAEEINDLVAERDEHTLEFFGLEDFLLFVLYCQCGIIVSFLFISCFLCLGYHHSFGGSPFLLIIDNIVRTLISHSFELDIDIIKN